MNLAQKLYTPDLFTRCDGSVTITRADGTRFCPTCYKEWPPIPPEDEAHYIHIKATL